MAQTIWIHKLADAKDGTTYRALFCDSCAKNYNDGHVRMANEPVLAYGTNSRCSKIRRGWSATLAVNSFVRHRNVI